MFKQIKSKQEKGELTAEQVEAFGREIRQLFDETRAKLGSEDLQVAEDYDRTSKLFNVAGRTLIHFGGPVSWLAGSTLLGLHYVIEFSQGHNILHGQYDSIEGPHRFRSETWKWDNTMDETDWKFEHHVVHHPFTNIMGIDNDFGFLVYRANANQPWRPHHLVQLGIILAQPVISSVFFPWYVSTSRAKAEGRDIISLKTYGPTLKKLAEYFGLNYLLFPVLAGPFGGKVIAGNFAAKTFANYYLQFILGTSHLGTEPEAFFESAGESEAEFYLRQCKATVNYQTPDFMDVVYGGINWHLEHHLFPDMPPNRLKEMAPRVQAICEKHGVPYHTGPFLAQIGKLVENVLMQSFPVEPGEGLIDLFANPAETAGRMWAGFTGYLDDLAARKPVIFHDSRVLSKSFSADNSICHLELERPRRWRHIHWRGGQYLSLQFKLDGRWQTRQYSLLKPGQKADRLQISVRRVTDGVVSGHIHNRLEVGQKVRLVGKPAGDFSLNKNTSPLVLAAAGVGITPLISMLEELADAGSAKRIDLLYFNRNVRSVIFTERLADLQRHLPGLHIHYYYSRAEGDSVEQLQNRARTESRHESPDSQSTAQRSFHLPGRFDADLLFRWLKANSDIKEAADQSDVYVCAPADFITAARSAFSDAGFRAVYAEDFAGQGLELDPAKNNVFHSVEFTKSGKKVMISEATTLLEAIEQQGITVPTGCRKGMCKACTVKKTAGTTLLEEKSGKAETFVTTCNNTACSDVKLDL